MTNLQYKKLTRSCWELGWVELSKTHERSGKALLVVNYSLTLAKQCGIVCFTPHLKQVNGTERNFFIISVALSARLIHFCFHQIHAATWWSIIVFNKI